MSARPNLLDGLVELFGHTLDKSRTLSILHVLTPALSAICIVLGQNREDRGDWAFLVAAAVALLVTAAAEALRARYRLLARQSELNSANALRVILKDALQPIAEMISDMQRLGKPERQNKLERVAAQCCSALGLILREIDDVRIVVYRIEVDDAGERSMQVFSYNRARDGHAPNPFIEGSDRGDAAFGMLATGEPCFVSNVDDEDEVNAAAGAYEGSRMGYKTFISAPINDAQVGYGMLTVDAPEAGVLVDTDKQLVALVADLLSIGFASLR